VLRRTLAVGVLIASFLPFGSRPAFACPLITKGSQARAASVVFTGTVSEAPPSRSAGPTRFEVDAVYKGPVVTTYEVTISTNTRGPGSPMRLNDRWTVFAIRRGGMLVADPCTGLVRGDIDPQRFGLPGGVSGIHHPLSWWLIGFTLAALVALVLAVVLVGRRRREAREFLQPK
jgi:hypothetical protein